MAEDGTVREESMEGILMKEQEQESGRNCLRPLVLTAQGTSGGLKALCSDKGALEVASPLTCNGTVLMTSPRL